MVDLVIDDRSDRGDISNGGAQQDGTCWVHYLGTWESWQNDTSCCRVGADQFILLTVQVQVQFRPHTLHYLQVMANVLQCGSNRAVIQVPYIELWLQLVAEVMYGQTEKESGDLTVVLPLETEVCYNVKTGSRVRNRKSGQRGKRLKPTHTQPSASCSCA